MPYGGAIARLPSSDPKILTICPSKKPKIGGNIIHMARRLVTAAGDSGRPSSIPYASGKATAKVAFFQHGKVFPVRKVCL
jgi:hypothetical protein